MERLQIILLSLIYIPLIFGQNLDKSRTVDWSNAGLITSIYNQSQWIDFVDRGADPTGRYSNTELLQDLIDAVDQPTSIFIPDGEYLFDGPIQLRSHITITGESQEATRLIFDLGGHHHCLAIKGKSLGFLDSIIVAPSKGERTLKLASRERDLQDVHVHLIPEDEELVFSDWARGSTGQVLILRNRQGPYVALEEEIRRDYLQSELPILVEIEPIKNVSIENLSIKRLDASEGQTSIFHFDYAYNCALMCVNSLQTNFAHVSINRSHHVEVNSSSFEGGFSYGGGGKAYGLAFQFASGSCLALNNVFRQLRHSVLLQAGANGNVIAYNYSRDPFWETYTLPSDAAGDLVLHGNFPYGNLFEGNVVQNIVVDDSHGENGPFNTFFRNRAQSYGLYTAFGIPSDQLNIIGNEITNANPTYGNFILNGKDHFIVANKIRGEIDNSNDRIMQHASFFLEENIFDPEFIHWPIIAYPNNYNTGTNWAELSFLNGFNLCSKDERTSSSEEIETYELSVFPNPSNGIVEVKWSGAKLVDLQILDLHSKVVFDKKLERNQVRLDLSDLDAACYLIRLKMNEKIMVKKLILN